MNLKKRTQAEIDQANSKKDYTGGYDFLPWLIHMRLRGYVIPSFGLLAGGIYCFFSLEDSYDVTFQKWAGVGCIIASALIQILLRREYLKLKLGITS